MSYTLKFLLGFEIDISFIKNIVDAYQHIINRKPIFTYEKRFISVGFSSMIHIQTYILYQVTKM